MLEDCRPAVLIESQLGSAECAKLCEQRLEERCQPFPGFFLYDPSRRQQPAALVALIGTLRLAEDRRK